MGKAKETKKPEYKEADIVVMRFAADAASVDVISLGNCSEVQDGDLEVDLKNGLWSFSSWENNKIGEMRSLYEGRTLVKYGVIGVYDRTNVEHLDDMANDAIRAVEDLTKRV